MDWAKIAWRASTAWRVVPIIWEIVSLILSFWKIAVLNFKKTESNGLVSLFNIWAAECGNVLWLDTRFQSCAVIQTARVSVYYCCFGVSSIYLSSFPLFRQLSRTTFDFFYHFYSNDTISFSGLSGRLCSKCSLYSRPFRETVRTETPLF